MGEWESKSPHWWAYRIPGLDRPYGHVVCHQQDTKDAEGAVWDAVVMVGCDDDGPTIAGRVAFDEAKAAIEQHAADHVNHV